MSKRTKKKKKVRIEDIKPRNWVVVDMIENTKPGAFVDKKRQASKDACRGRVEREDYSRSLAA
jgi:hypothetical protein